jgi:hypothetical protein
MPDEPKSTPQSPEVQPADVRDQLDQDLVTHQGEEHAPATDDAGSHMGAVDTEVTTNMPPMHGPGNVVGRSGSGDSDDDEDLIDPVDEITPG